MAIVTRLGGSAVAPAGPAYGVMLVETTNGRSRWRTAPAPGEIVGFEGAADRDRLLLLVRGAAGEVTLFALSHSTGRVAWLTGLGSIPVSGRSGPPDRAAFFQLTGERVFCANRAETPVAVSARELQSGDLDWVAYLPEDEGDLLLESHRDLLLVTGDHLHALEAVSGAERWRVEGPWLAHQEEDPWLLLRDREAERLLMVHAVSGEVRWRRTAPVSPSPVTALAWLPEGILVGEPGGGILHYDAASGRRAGRVGERYRVNEERELEWAFPGRNGMLFVAALEGGTRVIATDGTGRTAWELELDRLPTVGPGRTGSSGHLLLPPAPGDVGSVGSREDLWLVVRTAEAPTLVRIGLRDGTAQTIAMVAATSTTFAVDGARRRVYYVDPSRNLVGAGW